MGAGPWFAALAALPAHRELREARPFGRCFDALLVFAVSPASLRVVLCSLTGRHYSGFIMLGIQVFNKPDKSVPIQSSV